MHKNILWKGQAYKSLENCHLLTGKNGTEINAVIIGLYHNIIFKVEYFIKTNKQWETIFFEIKSNLNSRVQLLSYKSDGKGNWITNGKHCEQFNGCIDIDISVTPLTNSLPVNRLHLLKNESKKINVFYIDIFKQQLSAVQQYYTRLSEFKYKYENVPNDFEAVITVDELGLLTNYPKLFKRMAINDCKH